MQRALPAASIRTAGASWSVPFSVAVLRTVKVAAASSHYHSSPGKGGSCPRGSLCGFTTPRNHEVQGHLCRNACFFSPLQGLCTTCFPSLPSGCPPGSPFPVHIPLLSGNCGSLLQSLYLNLGLYVLYVQNCDDLI